MKLLWRTRKQPHSDLDGVKRAEQIRQDSEQSLAQAQRDVVRPLNEIRRHNRVSKLASQLIHGP